MNLNFLADSDQQIQNALTEEKLAHHLSVELAQGNHLFPSSICSPAIPHKMELAFFQKQVFQEDSRNCLQ